MGCGVSAARPSADASAKRQAPPSARRIRARGPSSPTQYYLAPRIDSRCRPRTPRPRRRADSAQLVWRRVRIISARRPAEETLDRARCVGVYLADKRAGSALSAHRIRARPPRASAPASAEALARDAFPFPTAVTDARARSHAARQAVCVLNAKRLGAQPSLHARPRAGVHDIIVTRRGVRRELRVPSVAPSSLVL
ncbi:hypothetical protein HYPSUDRAFT_205832 [Hypholoma sublateritium FD-334 SS-4]|uniref:Uncharacterized protein n=1 Tax=Hypholoma sublateritium (strain FD-334 SS-4) TaxID=945553 RepID=A0A0D2KT95_HYPSF|nr:hypothetical protein HYPSUDRAFT_205832 [Hypholoma sublateritium FD-334 SS-4]